MRSNIRQVAERAGVSRTTVSNVLLGRHDIVAPEKRDLVLQAARDLDYMPVRPTLQNRHVKTHVIAVPFDEPSKIGWTVNCGTYGGLCEAAMAHGYDVLMLLRADPDWAADRGEIQFLDRRSDGIIFASPIIGESERTFETLARHDVPVVVCYRRDLPAEVVWVDADNEGAMRGAVEHLFEMGHRKIVHLSGVDTTQFDIRERRRTFSAAMRERGLGDWADKIFVREFFAADAELVQQIVQSGATAVIAMNDLLAIDLKRAVQETGLSVPHDLSITGVDGVVAKENDLTSMEFSFADIGRYATEALVARLNGVPAAQCCREVPVQLAARGSVRNLAA